ncbi:hypothetical protein L218DRAFT_934715 [Marasmius fiardii PR-910]|nr:hypothetical protein L218DRAFT_934715 [Marasmius fiardii PR-910]
MASLSPNSSESHIKDQKPPETNTFLNAASNVFSNEVVIGVSLASMHYAVAEPDIPAGNSNYIQDALNVLDSIVDIGKVFPYVAPAFVLLKVIIEIEKSARDTSAKCRDLVERVTFMLSHLPALQSLHKDGTGITQSTRQVIDRMNNVLKDCTALIEAYRKQGVIARRLSLRNREKFEGCAQDLAGVTNDLLISLQIHQTTQMERMLNPDRVVLPRDDGDEEAEAFVNENGGEEVVKANRELVAMFAEDSLKVPVSEVNEDVMEELNANLTDIIRHNHLELEKKLNQSVSASVMDSLRALSELAVEKEKERTFVCVQCNKEFKQSTSGPNSCSFHKSSSADRQGSYLCCGSKIPCQSGAHRAKHHCDYIYGEFFSFAHNIHGYTDTKEDWITVEDTNLETNDNQFAQVSQLRRWKSQGGLISEPIILVRVGRYPSATKPYFFDTFTAKDLEIRCQVIDITKQTILFRTSSSDTEYAMAEWLINDPSSNKGRTSITGIRLTAKVATSPDPFIRVCPIDMQTCTKSGEALNISEGGFRSFTPLSPYTLPEVQRVSSEIYGGQCRPPRTDFKTRTTPNLPIILKALSDPPLTSNHGSAYSTMDVFSGAISVFNKHPAGTPNPISIASVDAYFRLIGDENYTPVQSLKILGGVQFPMTIDPRQTWQMGYKLEVNRSEEDAKLRVHWYNLPFIARKRPIRFKFVFRDVEDEEASIVVEYVTDHHKLDEKKPEDVAFFYVDDPLLWERRCVRVTPPKKGWDRDDVVVKIDGLDVKVDRLKKAVYSALKSGETEVDIGIGERKNTGDPDAWEWKALALVDISCRKVYAFKILITVRVNVEDRTGYACLGYVPCPDYGDVMNEAKPVRYAIEKVGFPDIGPCEEEKVLLDDAVDDWVPGAEKATAAGHSSNNAPQTSTVLPEELNKRLSSIDKNLERLANAMEPLQRLAEAVEPMQRIANVLEQLVDVMREARQPQTLRN